MDDWTVIGEYVYDVQGGHHQAFYAPVRDVTVLGEQIPAGERIKVEQSLKFSPENRKELLQAAGLVEKANWTTDDGDYGMHARTVVLVAALVCVTNQRPLPTRTSLVRKSKLSSRSTTIQVC